MPEKEYFQDYMPGDTCFGCGTKNSQGLQIKSFWKDDVSICLWQPENFHQGWKGLTCGGVIATLVDCHCIATSMATAYRNENRSLDSEPRYLFATGSINIRYLKPTMNNSEILLEARVVQIKNQKKYTLTCDVYSEGEKTADASVITLLVYRSDKPEDAPDVFKL